MNRLRPLDRLADRHGPAVQRDAEPAQYEVLEVALLRTSCVVEREREPLRLRPRADAVVRLEPEHLGPREILVVSRRLEDGKRRVEVGENLLRRPRRGRPQEREIGADRHRRAEALVAELRRDRRRVVEQIPGRVDFAARDERGRQPRDQRDPLR